jgi:hypothetical protein
VHWWIKLRRDGHVAVVKTTVSSLSEAQRHILKPYVAKYEERVNADGESLELIKAVISGLLGPGET